MEAEEISGIPTVAERLAVVRYRYNRIRYSPEFNDFLLAVLVVWLLRRCFAQKEGTVYRKSWLSFELLMVLRVN